MDVVIPKTTEPEPQDTSLMDRVNEKMKKIQHRFYSQTMTEIWLGEKEVSLITGRAVQTLRNDRFKGIGIPYSKIGRSCRYALSDVLEFMNSRKIQTEN